MTTARTNDDLVLVARIIAPHGVAGAVSAESYSDLPERFRSGAVLLTQNGTEMTVNSCSLHKGRLLLTLDSVSDRNAADKLRGCELFVRRGDSPALPEGSWYHYQLLGLSVRQGDELLGELTDVLNYSANDVYVVQRPEGGELLIPALKQIVRRVDLDAGVMEVELPEGLM